MTKFTDFIYFGVAHSKKASFFFKIISWVLKTPYSHSFMIYYDKDIQEFVVTHADKICVHTMLLKDFLKERGIYHLWSIKVDASDRKSFLKMMHRIDGETYSFIQILGIAIALIFKKNKNPFKEYDLDGDEDFICSEYFDYGLETIGHQTAYQRMNKGSDLITPKDNVEHMNILTETEETVKQLEVVDFIMEAFK